MDEWDGEFATMPTTPRIGGRPIPDLTRIPERLWQEVLLPLTHAERRAAAFDIALGARMHAAIALTESMPPGFSLAAARKSIKEGTTVPAPRPLEGPVRPQVNIRLDANHHERLLTAAELLGQKPTQLARMLVVNGVNRIFADQARLAVGRADDDGG